ncbi:UDP-4-amino-4,6-dideoxy-N-acetyl-beta-L-altrosamine N-acetyltransferase [Sediminibacillus massiliensis]|uniref:UDP-4-amino-4, 6-dideoxy-N-acetyl-beta-L-altrosamine N-acetyltransferase n=1 Tax=Sediminibacillus massiliensis TaxID=1926277 RepID=UPI0009884BC3|nr:UDP-4-amino-4,6-dideoxy-N-acetyl-beta-L-altrosamine N-acetyltransferase [Sediminibacillus massiliensis]
MVKMEDFHLKPITFEDLKTVLNWRNSERIKQWMYTDHYITWEEHCKWFEKVTDDDCSLVFVFSLNIQRLGVVSFRNIDKEKGTCEWGFYIGEKSAPKGAGTIMAMLALDKIFDETGIEKVCAEVIETNKASYRYHVKLGFETTGRVTGRVHKDGKKIDVIQMELSADKWPVHRAKLSNMFGGETS